MNVLPVESNHAPSPAHNGPRYYEWSFPGSPVTIHIAVDVIWRLCLEFDLDCEVHRRGLSKYSRHRNACGLLLGTVAPGAPGPLQVYISDYTAFTSDDAEPGSEAQTESVFAHLSRCLSSPDPSPRQPGQTVVGFFRTQPEDRPSVRKFDQPLLRLEQFSEIQAVLMIAGSDPERRMAGFLFREYDTIHPFSFMDFEFTATVRNEPPAPDIVDERADQPQAGPVPEIGPVLVPAPPAPAGIRPAAPPVASDAMSATRRLSRRQSLDIIGACLAGLLAGIFGTAGTWFVLTAWSATSSLHLQARPVDGGMAVYWNPPSGFASRYSGRLTVREKSNRLIIELDKNQLRAGKLFYGRVGAIVEFKLDIGDSASPVATDSVLAVLDRP